MNRGSAWLQKLLVPPHHGFFFRKPGSFSAHFCSIPKRLGTSSSSPSSDLEESWHGRGSHGWKPFRALSVPLFPVSPWQQWFFKLVQPLCPQMRELDVAALTFLLTKATGFHSPLQRLWRVETRTVAKGARKNKVQRSKVHSSHSPRTAIRIMKRTLVTSKNKLDGRV